jgi:hypothetical protein
MRKIGEKMTRFLTFAVLALLPPLAWGEGYICIDDMATGFKFENGEWQQSRFKPDSRYIVRPVTKDDAPMLRGFVESILGNAKWVVMKVGEPLPFAGCTEPAAHGSIFCKGLYEEFKMNEKSLRFLYAYLQGYWHPLDEGKSDTPLIEIGKCSPM